MKIGTRLFLSLVFPLVGLILLFAALDQRRSEKLLRQELSREGRAVARALQHAVEDALRDRQPEDIALLSGRLAGHEPILGIRVLDNQLSMLHQSPGLEAYPFNLETEVDRLVATGQPQEVRQEVGGLPVVHFLIPLTGPDGAPFGTLQVAQLESLIEKDARAGRRAVAMLTLLMIGATGLVVLVVTRVCVGRPVEALVESFREVGGREVPTRVARQGAAELSRLADAFNGMCQRLEASQRSLIAEQEERRRMEASLQEEARLAGLGRLAAGLAHEIGTPLNVIRGRAESLRRKLHEPVAADRSLQIIIGQIDRIVRIVRSMLDFASTKPPRRTVTAVGSVLQSVLELLTVRLEEAGVRVELELDTGLGPVSADTDQLHQVFLNLAQNAMDAMPDGGLLRVEASGVQRRHPEAPSGEEFIAVTFTDTGCGIPAEHRARVFDPFFTTKEVGRGSGLGLSVSYGIIREHGGWIEVDSVPPRGARLTVYLPAEAADVAAGPASLVKEEVA